MCVGLVLMVKECLHCSSVEGGGTVLAIVIMGEGPRNAILGYGCVGSLLPCFEGRKVV